MEVLLEKLDRRIEELRIQCEQLKDERQNNSSQLNDLKQKNQLLETECDMLKEKIQKVETKLFSMVSTFENESMHHNTNNSE